ncbi:transmembrane protein 53-like isoform X1 [Coccinella septempunctata]|uniref:transmembrane protein 53-like isoform X1 n=1 Tax=Coccinella septempunctata TaxID=41139 RepID=UPI001D065270|nr:transmembrane protein 53-like isoform X1 [Coccinella septempunctata]XP_044762655.1 transmembrane protein 53-like isoform X1 [Coccinella septempunctata]
MSSTGKKWEHYVTNVSDNFDYETLKIAPEEKFQVHNKTEIPTVILFGWAGAVDKYLKHYAKIYEERGLHTIRYIVPVKYLFFQSNKMLKIGEEMVDVFCQQKFKSSPIIIHVFSNGGGFQYEVFMRSLSKTPHQTQVKGMIFDSCPVKRGRFGLYNAIKANVDSKYLKVPISFLLTTYAILRRSLEMYVAQILKKECIQMNPYDNLMNEKCRWPQHFIYSTLDKVVRKESVESFAKHRKALGVDVTMKCYDNSQHVQHYMKNKSSYIRSVVKFVNKCLKR